MIGCVLVVPYLVRTARRLRTSEGLVRAESVREVNEGRRESVIEVGRAHNGANSESAEPSGGLPGGQDRSENLWQRVRLFVLRLLDAIPSFLEQHEFPFLIAFTVIYLGMTIAQTLLRPLWYDELYTLSVVRLGTLGEVWQALRIGIDQTPPLFNLITRGSASVFGFSEFGLRAPAIAGFWVFSMTLYAFVRRRASALYAAIAIAVPLVGFARYYAAEARPYGLLLAFSGLSLLFWQSATNESRRVWHLLALAASLICAVCVQYYGIVMVVPIAVGEAIKLRKRGYLDWPVVLALAAPAVAVAAQQSFINGSWVYSGGPAWYVPFLPALEYSYEDLLFRPPGVFAILIAALALTAWIVGFARGSNRGRWQMPASELAVAAATLLLPVIAYMIAVITNGYYMERYAIGIFTGFPVIIAWIAARSDRHWRPAAPVVLLVLVVSIFIAQARALYRSYAKRQMPEIAVLAQFTHQDPGTIVIADPLRFLEDWHHSPAWLRERICYIADPPIARDYQAADQDDVSLQLLSRPVPLCVKTLSEFVATHRQFLVFGQPGDGWILRKFLDEGVTVQIIGVKDGYQLLRVQWTKGNTTR